MATRCDNQCEPCTKDKAGTYICLKSESDFLASLLRVGGTIEGRDNYLLGLNPSELIDWYLYAKRIYMSHSSEDPIGWAFKLLDEIGKLVFGLTQVTWKKDGDQTFNLLGPLESELLTQFLGGTAPGQTGALSVATGSTRHEYRQATQEALKKCNEIEKYLQVTVAETKSGITASYRNVLECRIAYTQLHYAAGFSINLDTIIYQVWMLSHNKTAETSSVRLAAVFLHGLLRFGLLSQEVKPEDNLGYFLEQINIRNADEQSAPKTTDTPTHSIGELHFCSIPAPSAPEIKLSAELSASFAQEFLKSESASLFDVLFMCLEEDGWFWALNNAQLAQLKTWFGESAGPAIGALRDFRFRVAGVINHLEHTECLVNTVDDFKEEKFICVAAGYKLEERSDLAADFTQLENAIPGVDNSSFYYFRISSHSSDSQGGKQLLPGALVAVFPIERELSANARSAKLSRIRGFVERWRAKIEAIPAVRRVVREIARPHQEKTARAAIMSRNLSHNVGSHSLANPRFFEALGVLHEAFPPTNQGDDEFQPLVYPHAVPEREYPPSEPSSARCPVCKQAMKPVGAVKRDHEGCVQFKKSRTLGGKEQLDTGHSTVLKGEAWRARNRLGALNSYLQARMDFIARALGETSSQPEPMFFIADVLKGFWNQTVLLNTLLSDNGYTAEQLRFVVKLPNSRDKAIVFTGRSGDHEMRHTTFACEENEDFRDVLVAIPGGMVGRHTLYAFFENILRNSAKYGSKSVNQAKARAPQTLDLHLTLLQRQAIAPGDDNRFAACFVLQIHDNISEDFDCKKIEFIRKHIARPIIDGEGIAQTEGHGIQEMKVCAGFLAGGDKAAFAFPADTDNRVKESLGDAYASFSEKSESKLDGTSALVCHPVPVDNPANPYIGYSLLMLKPVLLGIVDYQTTDNPAESAATTPARQFDSVVFYHGIADLAGGPAAFGVIRLPSASCDNVSRLLDEIAKLHTKLPFRLMVVTDRAGAKMITDQLKDCSINLPANRVKVVAHNSLVNATRDTSEEGWKDIILSVYDEWLLAYKGDVKGPNSKWHLVIGFERAKDYVAKKWNISENGDFFLGFHKKSNQLRISVTFSGAEGTGQMCWTSESDQVTQLDKSDPKVLLVLDNHGNAVAGEKDKGPLDDNAAYSYHPFSGSQQVDLFQLLDSPPRDLFTRSMLLYSVAEAMLTNVVVVDERVADACLLGDSPQPFGLLMKEKQRMRLFPVYSVRKNGHRFIVSDTARSSLEAQTEGGQSEAFYPDEGLTVADPPKVVTYARDASRKWELTQGDAPDVIVVHEGVTDALHNHQPCLWNAGDHRMLYKICPWIVRTSGRGSQSRHIGDNLPFYEFSELSDAAYRQANKVALVRGLLSLRGKTNK